MTIPVSAVPGIGPKTTEFLHQHGITTAKALIKAGIDQLCQAPGFHINRAQAALDAAKQLIGVDTPASKATGKPAKERKVKKKKQEKEKVKDKKTRKKKTTKDGKGKKSKKTKRQAKKKTDKKTPRKKDKNKGNKKK